MNRDATCLRICLLLALAAAPLACGGDEGGDASDDNQPAGPARTIGLSYPAGTYQVIRIQRVEQTVTVDGRRSPPTNYDQEVTFELEVEPPDADGVIHGEVRFVGVRDSLATDGPPVVVSMDGGDPVSRALLGPLKKLTCPVVLNPDGTVRHVDRLAAYWNDVAQRFPNQPALTNTLANRVGPDRIRKALERPARVVPENPVRVGATWSATIPVKLAPLGGFDMPHTCRLDSVEETDTGRLATIAFHGSQPAPEAFYDAVADAGAGEAKRIDVQDRGEITVDLDTGLWRQQSQTFGVSMVTESDGRDVQVELNARIRLKLKPQD